MKPKPSRRDLLRCTAGIGAAGLAGCIGSEESGTREIQYATLMPLTGDLGSLGPPIRDGALLPRYQLEDDVDFSFDVADGDSQTNPDAGISEAQSLVDSGYPAVVGPAASNVTLQVGPNAFIPNEVVGISPAATAPALTELDDDGYIFRTTPSDALQGIVMAEVAVDHFEAETAGTLYLNDDYGQALESEFSASFESLEGDVLNRVSFEPEQADYSSQISNALEDDPDLFMVVGFPQSGIQLFRDFYNDFDTGIDILAEAGLTDETLPDEVGNPMDNVMSVAPSADGPGVEFFNEEFETEFDSSPGVFSAHAYDAAAVIILSNVMAGENDGTAIRDNIRNVSNPDGESFGPAELAEAVETVSAGDDVQYEGAASSVVFDENGDIVSAIYNLNDFRDGEIEVYEKIEFDVE